MLTLCSKNSDMLYKERSLLQLFSLLPAVSRAIYGTLLAFLYDFCQFHPDLCDRIDFLKDSRSKTLFTFWGEILFAAVTSSPDYASTSRRDLLDLTTQATRLLAKGISKFSSSPSFFKSRLRSVSLPDSQHSIRANSIRALSELTSNSTETPIADQVTALANIRSLVLDGTVYVGHVDGQNRPHGTGAILSPDGSYFVGNFVEGKRQGAGSCMSSSDDVTTTVTSTYDKDQLVGNCTEVSFTPSNISIFAGTVSENKRNGPGLAVSVSNDEEKSMEVTSASWQQDQITGLARIITNDAVFNGQIDSEGSRTGVARVISSTGIYEGHLVNGKPHGQGSWLGIDGERFSGTFREGIKEGEGSCQYADGSIFKGNFIGGVFHGYGELTRPNGEYYKGMFAEGKRHGKGVLEDSVAKFKFIGKFSNNQKHGEGVEWINGIEAKGVWNEGKRIGKFTVVFPCGVALYCSFKDGQLSGMAEAVSKTGGRVTGDASVFYSDLVKGKVPRELSGGKLNENLESSRDFRPIPSS
ncbi:hypothetical protein GEMRC1_006129 [Eukaryota sp. GEM-RC1]